MSSLLLLLLLLRTTLGQLYFDRSLPDLETILSVEEMLAAGEIYRDEAEMPQEVNDTAMYHPGRFEGDIVNNGLSSRTIKNFMGEHTFDVQGVMRNAVRQTYLKWTDARIPFTISSQFNSYGRTKVAEAMAEYRKLTCIDWAPKTAADQDYVHILPDDGCYSLVGRVGGKQPVSLGEGCIQKGIIIHELMHAVGFFHEQSRADRDEYVTINWMNVEPGLQDQFDKYSLNMIDHLGTKYDYGSVMHYAPTAFSKNGKPTIEPKEEGAEIGQRNGFSQNDLYKINKLYNCPQLETVEATTVRSRQTTRRPSPISPGIGGTGSVPGDKEPIKAVCQDGRRDCPFLARAGHCESRFSARFMAENCPLSCKKCDGGDAASTSEGACQDSRSWCQRWAGSGMCNQLIFRDYMRSKCAKSCKLC